jgi:hypothetical protein
MLRSEEVYSSYEEYSTFCEEISSCTFIYEVMEKLRYNVIIITALC